MASKLLDAPPDHRVGGGYRPWLNGTWGRVDKFAKSFTIATERLPDYFST
jgi:hypothetical protein